MARRGRGRLARTIVPKLDRLTPEAMGLICVRAGHRALGRSRAALNGVTAPAASGWAATGRRPQLAEGSQERGGRWRP
jgi:hypothetical protein